MGAPSYAADNIKGSYIVEDGGDDVSDFVKSTICGIFNYMPEYVNATPVPNTNRTYPQTRITDIDIEKSLKREDVWEIARKIPGELLGEYGVEKDAIEQAFNPGDPRMPLKIEGTVDVLTVLGYYDGYCFDIGFSKAGSIDDNISVKELQEEIILDSVYTYDYEMYDLLSTSENKVVKELLDKITEIGEREIFAICELVERALEEHFGKNEREEWCSSKELEEVVLESPEKYRNLDSIGLEELEEKRQEKIEANKQEKAAAKKAKEERQKKTAKAAAKPGR